MSLKVKNLSIYCVKGREFGVLMISLLVNGD